MDLTRPAITRLARKAGVKSVSEECFDRIRELIYKKLNLILKNALIISSQKNTKTLMKEDIYEALEILKEYISRTNDL